MSRSRFRPSPARERWVLAAGFAAAAALSGAALTVLPDPDAAGSAEVARASADVARAVQESWATLRTAPDGLIASRPDLTSSPLPQLSPEESSPLVLNAVPGATAFDALLAESAFLESYEKKIAEALSAIQEAIAAADDDERLARGLFRKIQLSVKAQDLDSGLEAWRLVEKKWSPQVALHDVSLRLQCALAAAPLMSEGERARAQSPLAQSFEAGSLPLPGEPELDEEGYPRETASAAFWIDRLESMSEDPGGRAAIARGRTRRARSALAKVRSIPQATSPGEWTIDFETRPVLAHWTNVRGGSQLRFVDLQATRKRVVQDAVLPDGFEIAFEEEELEYPLVRDRTRIPGTPLAFRIGHEAPDRLRQAQVKRARYGRLGLLGLALALILTSFFTARMLRRERRLAELKTRFIAGVSHDLRTPLASILLMAENLEEGRVQDESGRERYFRAIRGEADRLRRLVDDVLDFSRIERGEGTKLKLEDTDLESYADELERELRARVERGGAHLSVECVGLERGFVLDRDAIRRALWNLVDNALVHGGGGEIRLALRASEDALVLEVEDSGPGIPTPERDKIFEPFRQGNSPHADHAGGTGLGLAIVREIARAHGGEVIALAGPKGRGALFRITLPQSSNETTG